MKLTILNLADARTEEMKRTASERTELATKQGLAPDLFGLTNGGDAEDATYRRISSANTRRDLNPIMQERMQQVAYYLRVTVPLAKRIIEVITSYVVGEGFHAVAKDAAVQQVIDGFWNDPINCMPRRLGEWTDELSTFGEIAVPIAVNPVNGRVRIGFIDPREISAIEFGALATGDGRTEISIPVALHLKQDFGQAPRELMLVRREEDVTANGYGGLNGECFYHAINKAMAASRGISELFALADWLDVFDQMMFDFADRARFLNAFVWDVVLKGGDQKKVDEYTKKFTQSPPRQGGALVHTDSVEVKPMTPDLKGGDMSELARELKRYGLGGAGLPPTFFGDPTDANRSTADEMSGPTGKKFTDRQNDLKQFVTEVLDLVIEKAIEHGVLAKNVDRSYKIETPDLLIKDLQRAGTTLGAVTASLTTAEDRGWIQAETAARSFHTVLSQIGVEVDSAEEFKRAQADKVTRDARNQDGLNPQKNLATALNDAKTPAVPLERLN